MNEEMIDGGLAKSRNLADTADVFRAILQQKPRSDASRDGRCRRPA